jgi:hypothetical protein
MPGQLTLHVFALLLGLLELSQHLLALVIACVLVLLNYLGWLAQMNRRSFGPCDEFVGSGLGSLLLFYLLLHALGYLHSL